MISPQERIHARQILDDLMAVRNSSKPGSFYDAISEAASAIARAIIEYDKADIALFRELGLIPKEPQWPRGWIYDRPDMPGKRRFRVEYQDKQDDPDTLGIYAASHEEAAYWLRAKGIKPENIISKKQFA